MYFPETRDFRIDNKEDDEDENNLGENEVLDIEAAKKPTALKT